MPPHPSEPALLPRVLVEHMMALAHHLGIEKVLRALADEIEGDFKRRESFDKTACVAGHSDVGDCEVTPTPDGVIYRFKCINGHSKNAREVCRPRRRSDFWRM